MSKQLGVSLYMRVDADDPQAAVAAFIDRVNRFGLSGFTYSVEDVDAGDLVFVDNGQAYSEQDYIAKQTTMAEGADGDGKD